MDRNIVCENQDSRYTDWTGKESGQNLSRLDWREPEHLLLGLDWKRTRTVPT